MAEEKKSKLENSNILAAVSYVSILSVILYILKKDDEFVRFHSRQGIVIFALSLFMIVPFIGIFAALVALILMVVGALKAYKGEKFRIPVVADIAEKIEF